MTFRFADPLILLLFFAILVFYLFNRRLRLRFSGIPFSDIRLIPNPSKNWKIRLLWLPLVFQWISLLLLTIGAARPQIGFGRQIINGTGVDIVLVLDISSSMQQEDFFPLSRLDSAKSVMIDFVREREYDRIGFVVFAQRAYQIIPPTLDYDVLIRALESTTLATDQRLVDGTAIGLGIAAAGNMLRESDSPSKVIILLTDGANNGGEIGPLTASKAVAVLGMKIYTVAMTSSGTVSDQIDEETLMTIAELSHGKHFRADNTNSLEQIYSQIDTLEQSQRQREVLILWQDIASIFIGFGLILSVVEYLVRSLWFQVIP